MTSIIQKKKKPGKTYLSNFNIAWSSSVCSQAEAVLTCSKLNFAQIIIFSVLKQLAIKWTCSSFPPKALLLPLQGVTASTPALLCDAHPYSASPLAYHKPTLFSLACSPHTFTVLYWGSVNKITPLHKQPPPHTEWQKLLKAFWIVIWCLWAIRLHNNFRPFPQLPNATSSLTSISQHFIKPQLL